MNQRRSIGAVGCWILAVGLLAGCGSSSPADGGTDVFTPGDATADGAGDGGAMMCATHIGPCDPIANTGCTGGQSCVIADSMGTTTTQCVTPGTATEGTRCVSPDACAAGLFCLNNACTRGCCGPGDNARCTQGGATGVCNLQVMIGTTTISLCRPTTACDWFAQNCAGGGNCVATDRAGTTVCDATGPQALDQPCGGAAGACVRGLYCAQTGTAPASCRQLCDPLVFAGEDAGVTPDGGVSRACGTGLRCSALMDRPDHFGVCIPM